MGFGKISKVVTVVIFTSAIFSGCIRHYNRTGGIEPQYHPIKGEKYELAGKSKAESSSFRLLWLIPVTKQICFNDAVEQAINSRGGDNLIEIRWWFERRYWVVGTVDVLYVEGNVIRYIEEEEGKVK